MSPDLRRDKRTLHVVLPTGVDLRDAMDKAMARITLDDIANAAGCSVNTLKQSRLKPDNAGYRSPPASLRRALFELCRERAKYFIELAEELRPPKGP